MLKGVLKGPIDSITEKTIKFLTSLVHHHRQFQNTPNKTVSDVFSPLMSHQIGNFSSVLRETSLQQPAPPDRGGSRHSLSAWEKGHNGRSGYSYIVKIHLERSAKVNMEDTRRGLPERQAWSRIRMRVTIMCRSRKHVMKEIIQIRTFNVTNLVENTDAFRRQQ